MSTNHRPTAARTASPRLALVASAAALATLAAASFLLLHPMGGKAASNSATVVSTAKTSLGRILVNSRGHTLYLLGSDPKGKSTCSGMCAKFWPPLISAAQPRVEGGAKASLVGRIRRSDGRMQVTYNHHPLYTFVKDTAKGQTKGEGVKAFGGTWDAVSVAGAKVVRHAPPPNPIPQHNGGDHDSDNNGGPSDGDGNI